MALVFHLTDKDISVHLQYQDVTFTIQQIEGVYCGINIFESTLWEQFSPKDAEYAARETQALWLAILQSLPCRVVNPPALDSLAGTLLSTPETLYLAHRLGFYIPMSISLESGMIAAELLGAGVPARCADLGEVWVNETYLRREDITNLKLNEDHFRVSEELLGKPIYLTLVGSKIFACEVHSGGSVVPLPINLIPRLIKSRLRTLHKRLNLTLAEYSFRIMTDGYFAFLGCTRPPVYTVAALGDEFIGQVIDYAVGKG
jgi:hypothetical protein